MKYVDENIRVNFKGYISTYIQSCIFLVESWRPRAAFWSFFRSSASCASVSSNLKPLPLNPLKLVIFLPSWNSKISQRNLINIATRNYNNNCLHTFCFASTGIPLQAWDSQASIGIPIQARDSLASTGIPLQNRKSVVLLPGQNPQYWFDSFAYCSLKAGLKHNTFVMHPWYCGYLSRLETLASIQHQHHRDSWHSMVIGITRTFDCHICAIVIK